MLPATQHTLQLPTSGRPSSKRGSKHAAAVAATRMETKTVSFRIVTCMGFYQSAYGEGAKGTVATG